MSPILVRPVREQLEHDRIIRLLQTKLRRKYDAGINPGSEQAVPVGNGPTAIFPDLVLSSLERGKRLQAVVEVETGESVIHLEALAEWAHLARVRTAFHVYVPSGMVDVARQLCDDNNIHVNEIWSYNTIGDEVRFALVHRGRTDAPAEPRARAETPSAKKGEAPPAKKSGAPPVKKAGASRTQKAGAASAKKAAAPPAKKAGASSAKKTAAPLARIATAAKSSAKPAKKPAVAVAKTPAKAAKKPARAQKRK